MRKFTADPLLFRLVMLVLACYALMPIYILFARNIPKAMAYGMSAEVALHLVAISARDIVPPLVGVVGLYKKKAWVRIMLLYWLPLLAIFGAPGYARGYTGSKNPGWEALIRAWVIFGGFNMLIFAYMMRSEIRLLFEPKQSAPDERAFGRRRRLQAGRRARKPTSNAQDADTPKGGDD